MLNEKHDDIYHRTVHDNLKVKLINHQTKNEYKIETL